MQDTEMHLEVIEWSNKDNNAFYEAVKADGLKGFAQVGGLKTYDMDILKPYWSQAQAILEVGAGYGRVIDYLLQHQFKGTITAVEQCNALFEYLEEKFGSYRNVNLIHENILKLDSGGHFDLILLLWGFISDFSPREHLSLFEQSFRLLRRKGKLVVDTIPVNVKPLFGKKCGKRGNLYSIDVDKASINGYLPEKLEIESYAQEAGFSNMVDLSFKTDVDRVRLLYIFD